MAAALAGVALMANPLLVDYVHSDSKGLASAQVGLTVAIAAVIIVLGEFRLVGAGAIDLGYIFVGHAVVGVVLAGLILYGVKDVYERVPQKGCCA